MTDDLKVTGPITGGSHGWAFAARMDDVAAYGYVEEEYFLEGTAAVYGLADGASFTVDGRWSTEAKETLPFRTRLLVRRPADPAHFNGTVILEWNNVSMMHDLMMYELPGLAALGFAHVGVSAQRLGVHGAPDLMGDLGDPLVRWDPERYGSLDVPSEDLSFGIFTQAARAVGPKRPTSPADPMNDLHVERVIGTGVSQSAQRLHTYINGVHSIEGVIDGFIPLMQAGPMSPLVTPSDVSFSPFADETGAGTFGDIEAPLPLVFFKLRDDLAVPIFIFNSEVDAQFCLPIRRPDSDNYRSWEIAGTSHGGDSMERQLALDKRDMGQDYQPMMAFGTNTNGTSWNGPLHAALVHLDRWIATGDLPPSMPPIEVGDEAGKFRRDEHGNAIGGVRLPHVEAPVAALYGQGDASGWLMSLSGKTIPFSDEKLRGLYGDHATYVAKVKASADAAVVSGTLLAPDAAALVAAAESSSILA